MTPDGYVRLDTTTVAPFVAKLPALRALLGGDPHEWHVREVGDGNLNLVFIVDGAAGGICVKQSLPHIRALESWQLSVERTFFEHAYFAAVREHAGGHIPAIFHYEPQLYCLIMERLAPHIILRGGLIAGMLYPRVATDVAEYVARTTFFTSDLGQPLEAKLDGVALFAKNHALLRITSDLVFTDPYRTSERNRWTSPQLDGLAAAIAADAPLKIAAARLGRTFLTRTQALIHGDLHTGSIMVTAADTRIIDPEFAFYGPIGMDLGAFVGNLLMNYFAQAGHTSPGDSRAKYADWVLAQIGVFWNRFRTVFRELWETSAGADVYAPAMFGDAPSAAALAAERELYLDELFGDMLGFAGVKMIRRIFGFAHNSDFERIADSDRRAACEAGTVDLARAMLLAPAAIRSCDDLIDLARRLVRAPQPAGTQLPADVPLRHSFVEDK